MIKFFRHIRKSLIEKNQMGKYFKYAIGEILLVVIGILIALQINNWNEERKSNQKEEQLIGNLHTEFQKNYEELLVDIKRLQSVEQASYKLLKIMQQAIPIVSEKELDSLISKTLYSPTWNPSSFVMEELKKSGGFSQLNNSELKNALLDWERYYGNLREVEESFVRSFNNQIHFLAKEGSLRNADAENRNYEIGKSILPKKNIDLLKNQSFENHLDDLYISSAEQLSRYLVVQEKIEVILILSKEKN